MKVSEIKTALARIDSDAGRRLSRLCSLFLDRYGDGPGSLLRAPARIDVLGEHIDYVSYLPTASLTFGSREHDVLMLYKISGEPRVRSASTSRNYEPSSFSILEDQVPEFGQNVTDEWLAFLSHHGTPTPHWQNYIRGAVTFARAKFGEREGDCASYVVLPVRCRSTVMREKCEPLIGDVLSEFRYLVF